jgi:hypothetical protein
MLMSLTEKDNSGKTTHIRVYLKDKIKIMNMRDDVLKSTPDVIEELMDKYEMKGDS